jgi:tetratricopeptide (TPR) repeat protein
MQEQRSGAALAAYDAVLKMTPVYAYSDTFLTKCSRAYDALSAGRHPYGRLLALRKTVSSPLSQSQGQSQAMLRPSLEVARTELREIQAIPPSKPVERALADLGRRLEVTAWVQEGLADTGAGRLNMALRSFARAYQLRPELSTAFFLARTYFVLGDENAAIEMLLRLQEDVANPMVRADMVCTLGDAYSNLGRLRLARHYYSLCETTDDEDNFRAIRALTGGGK